MRIRLKQTLQYGNEFEAEYSEQTETSLKQTLQYGNNPANMIVKFNKPGLKQTLQYGNWEQMLPQYSQFCV